MLEVLTSRKVELKRRDDRINAKGKHVNIYSKMLKDKIIRAKYFTKSILDHMVGRQNKS